MTKLYLITFEAEVSVQVEADDEEEAANEARTAFRHTDVRLSGTWDAEVLSDGDEEEDE